MSNDKRPPLRFWIGLHRDGSGRQCIVDFHGDTMDGVKAAWNEKNEKRLTTMETVIEPELSRGSVEYLGLLKKMEGMLGDPRLPTLEKLLHEVAMAAYEQGMQSAGLRPKRP
ncbi:MAG TPA: hypothetical protein VL283_05285 [Candidatus Baltobacteraceae bacterium]|nr:hypothetical protein [Candidatus Baltobacteraceae bacterium]